MLGVDPRDVLIVLNEIPLENWGIRGGQSAADVDLGFALDV
jgi:phenylpyruvate tautomerase PptA (4-oxalocrotonate tautomerase family)